MFDFGREGGDLVCISEHLPGETLAAWVRDHGPMPPDATLRMAEQVVSALSSANFHKVAYPAIEPANVVVVPGVTPEGTWPLIKLTGLGLPGSSPSTDETAEHHQYLSLPTTVDFRSQVSSLGATMYFLLTGGRISMPIRPRQLRVLPKPLRALLWQILRRSPEQRPKDAVVLAEMIRECLLKIERREKLARRFGIPWISNGRTRAQPRHRLRRIALAATGIVVLALIIGAFSSSARIGKFLQGRRSGKTAGVLVGVPEASPTPPIQKAAAVPTHGFLTK